ncbi:MAG: hypothetical protein K0V04_15265 [Deltaproteobacteria bacterium]|nr:hypothetical protein [Deltaproteobacteria bacterium]
MVAEVTDEGSRLDARFVEQLLEAFVSLAKGDFEARLPRTGIRDTQDTIAYLVNLMAEEVGELFSMRSQHRDRMERLIEAATDALVKIAAGEFDARMERSFNGGPEDVLAYLVNTAGEEVQELFDELEQKNALLEEQATRLAIGERSAFATLSAGVGHELNNPLSYSLGNLEYLQHELQQLRNDGNLDRVPEMLTAISDAKEGLGRAARIAADLKKLTPSSEIVFTRSEVDDLVESALALIRNTVSHRAMLRCEYGDVPSVMADHGRLGQVIVNLVQNALHALPLERSTEDNVVEIRTMRHDERMVGIEIRDNGQGISPDSLPRIFDSFYTTRPTGQGTGLGLSISKRIIAGHGGRIEVESEYGQGSVFRVLLPVARGPG